MEYDVIVLACDYNAWIVEPFYHLANKYWPNQQITLVAEDNYSKGASNCQFLPLPREMCINRECPAYLFSNTLRWALKQSSKKLAIILLADYFIYSDVNQVNINRSAEYMLSNPDVLRIDMGDRPRSGTMRNINDIFVECAEGRNCFLPVSLTPGLWNIHNYLLLLENGWDPWGTERHSQQKFLNQYTHMKSIYCEPGPIFYSNTLRARDNSALVIRHHIYEEVKHYIPPRFKIMYED
jgi:hypothetical protein